MDYYKFKNSTPLVNTEEREQASHIEDCVTLLKDNKERTRIAIKNEKEALLKKERAEKLEKLRAKGRFRRRIAGTALGIIALSGTISGAISAADYFQQRNTSKDISNRADGYTVEEVMESPIIDYITPKILCSEETIYEYFTAIEKYESLSKNSNSQTIGSKEATDLAESAQYIQEFTKTLLPSTYTQAIKENIALATNLNTFKNESYIRDEDIIHHNNISIKTSTVDYHPYIMVNEGNYNSYSLNCNTLSNDIPLCYKTAVNDVLEITGQDFTEDLSIEDCIKYGKNFKGLLCTYLVMDTKGNLKEVDTETFIKHTKNVRDNLGTHYDINSVETLSSENSHNNKVQNLSNIKYTENER